MIIEPDRWLVIAARSVALGGRVCRLSAPSLQAFFKVQFLNSTAEAGVPLAASEKTAGTPNGFTRYTARMSGETARELSSCMSN